MSSYGGLQLVAGITAAVVGLIFLGWLTGGQQSKSSSSSSSSSAHGAKRRRAGPIAAPREPFPAPEDYVWQKLKIIGLILKPLSWSFHETDSTAILQKNPKDQTDTSITITCFPHKDGGFLVKFAEQMPIELLRSGKIVSQSWKKDAVAEPFVKFTMIYHDQVLDEVDGDEVEVEYNTSKHKSIACLLANSTTGTIYLIMLEIPMAKFEEELEIGQTIIGSLTLSAQV